MRMQVTARVRGGLLAPPQPRLNAREPRASSSPREPPRSPLATRLTGDARRASSCRYAYRIKHLYPKQS